MGSPPLDRAPTLSLIVLAWNNLEFTEKCVESLRRHTAVPHELVMVDNGSSDGSALFAEAAADVPVLNESNLGFAAGMNAGLAKASGEYVAFINNDTVFPEGWATTILETFVMHPNAGIVLPAVTAAGNQVTVRERPGIDQLVLTPFGELPSGVVYVMKTDVIRALGGWNEEYRTASAEDLDLSFTVWAHGLDIVLDERVLVEHESQASVRLLPDRKVLYKQNLTQFLDRWQSSPLGNRPLLEGTDQETLEAGQEQARLAVIWIRRMLAARAEARTPQQEPELPPRRQGWLRSRS
jgi:O-antigen biosynthesis protein